MTPQAKEAIPHGGSPFLVLPFSKTTFISPDVIKNSTSYTYGAIKQGEKATKSFSFHVYIVFWEMQVGIYSLCQVHAWCVYPRQRVRLYREMLSPFQNSSRRFLARSSVSEATDARLDIAPSDMTSSSFGGL